MKLFVAKRNYDYEGFHILGVFSTKEAAQNVIENDFLITKSEFYPNQRRMRGDSYDIEEIEVDKLYR